MKKHHASDAGAVTREKIFKAQRDAKKDAYAADEPARNARNEARAAEEQALAEARAAEKQARAEARAAEEQARADAFALAAATAPLTEEETAALHAGGRTADLVRRGVAARARDVDLEAKGKAKEVKKRQQNRKHSVDTRKRKKAKVEGLVQEEAQLMKRAAGFLVDLGRGGSTVLDVLDREAFREDEEAIKALVAARDREKDKKERKNLTEKVRRARQKLAAKEQQLRVALLEDRVAELEEELRGCRAAAATLRCGAGRRARQL